MRVQLTDILVILPLILHTVSSVGLTVLKGSPVTLTTTQYEDRKTMEDLKWKFNETQTIVSYLIIYQGVRVNKLYKGRVEFNTSDFSLTLKNVQRSDSGLYTAVMDFADNPEETIAEYELSVLEPVAAPTLTVEYNSSSSDSCKVTLNCTGLNVSLISSCNFTFCSQEGGNRFLSISVNSSTISCNHSNPVSWKQATVELKSVCPSYKEKTMEQKGDTPWWTIVGVIVGLLLVILIVLAVIIRRMKGGTQTDHNPQSNDHSAQEGSQEMDPVSQPGGVESPGSTDNPYDAPVSQTKCNTATAQTVYDTVKLPLPHSPSTQDSPLLPEASADVGAETLYAVVDKKNKVCPV